MLPMGLGRPERVLVLDYNTILFNSVGFVNLMIKSGLDHELFNDLDQFGLVYFFTIAKLRNTASIIDPSVNEIEYFSIIKKKYTKIADMSPPTDLFSNIKILSLQSFVDEIFIASYNNHGALSEFDKVTKVTFDIFDITSVEKFIIENGITSVFSHDIHLVYDLVFRFNIDLKTMNFIISKLGYNFSNEINEYNNSKCPQVFDLRRDLGFNIAYINLNIHNVDFSDIDI